MSIVYDYLKQVQDKKEPVEVPVQDEKKTPPVKSVPKHRRKSVLVVAGIVGLALFCVAVFFLTQYLRKPETITYRETRPIPIRVIRSFADPGLALEGIIYNPAQPFAIINGKMLEVKGKIGDLEVTKITPDSVTLRDVTKNTSRTLHL